MFKIHVEKECGCFKKSNYENNKAYASKDDALMEAKRMEGEMNELFCKKHQFYTEDTRDGIIIHVEERAREEHTGSSCGGGHCA
jgi:hypothetical protein